MLLLTSPAILAQPRPCCCWAGLGEGMGGEGFEHESENDAGCQVANHVSSLPLCTPRHPQPPPLTFSIPCTVTPDLFPVPPLFI